MKEAGIGGVEINTIEMPDVDPGDARRGPLPRVAEPGVERGGPGGDRGGARERGMTADLIVGSGWPFGGRFLEGAERTQRVRLVKVPLPDPGTFEARLAELAAEKKKERDEIHVEPRLAFLRLVPGGSRRFEAGTELRAPPASSGKTGRSGCAAPAGHVLHVGILEEGFTLVKLGAPGADGPVVDHWDAAAVRRYLDRMSKGLGPGARGLAGRRAPRELRGQPGARPRELDGRPAGRVRAAARLRARALPALRPRRRREGDGTALADTVRRARYDFHRTVVELFQERFLATYVGWCHDNGRPRPDPGLRARDPRHRRGPPGGPPRGRELALVGPRPDREQPHRRQQVRLLGGAPGREAAHQLRGDDERGARLPRDASRTSSSGWTRALSPASCTRSSTASTTRRPRRASPAGSASGPGSTSRTPGGRTCGASPTTRRASPRVLGVGLPGERGPPRAEGGRVGARRPALPAVPGGRGPLVPLPSPAALASAGYGTDFVSEGVLQASTAADGRLRYGPRAYETLLVLDVESLEPETARAIARFAEAGGASSSSAAPPTVPPGLFEAESRDRAVQGGHRGRPRRGRRAGSPSCPPPRPGPLGGLGPDPSPPAGLRPPPAPALGHHDAARLRSRAAGAPRRAPRRRRASCGTGSASGRSSSSPTPAPRRPWPSEPPSPHPTRRPWRWDPETGGRAPYPVRGRGRVPLDPPRAVRVAAPGLRAPGVRTVRGPGPTGGPFAPRCRPPSGGRWPVSGRRPSSTRSTAAPSSGPCAPSRT